MLDPSSPLQIAHSPVIDAARDCGTPLPLAPAATPLAVADAGSPALVIPPPATSPSIASVTRGQEVVGAVEPSVGATNDVSVVPNALPMVACAWLPLYRRIAPSATDPRPTWNNSAVPVARSDFRQRSGNGTLIDRRGRCACTMLVPVSRIATCLCEDEALCHFCASSYSTWRRHASKRMGSGWHRSERNKKAGANMLKRKKQKKMYQRSKKIRKDKEQKTS